MPNIKQFADPQAVAAAFAEDFFAWIESKSDDESKLTVALSGGSTPQVLFDLWAEKWTEKISWHRIHFYWGDERCVPPDDPESNFGVAKRRWLDKIEIPDENIHRIQGESNPSAERSRYEQEIQTHVASGTAGVPQFDLVILGMGDDGHTASIFPDQMRLLKSDRLTEVAIHPTTGQQRITLTGPVLNAATRVAFLITGENKSAVLSEIVNRTGNFESYPIAYVAANEVDFYIDAAAAKCL